jgi:predicted alpha-1,6-mannanase (GH76 family)
LAPGFRSAALPEDATGDGRVDVHDAAYALRQVLGLSSLSSLSAPPLSRRSLLPWAGGDAVGIGLPDVATIAALEGLGHAFDANADRAAADLIRHYWVGNEDSGHILPTRDGYATTEPPNGYLWESAQMLCVLENLYQTSHSPSLLRRLRSQWAFLRERFGVQRMASVGEGSANGWSDDAGWSALMLLSFHRSLGDDDALKAAGELVRNAVARWEDTTTGGLWYRDNHREKASYQASVILAAVRLYELTGDRFYWDRAVALADWVETALLRPDGLYYVEADRRGPRRNDRPPEQGSSDTFLGGNMAMGVVYARLYRDSGDARYRQRALRVAAAILAVETTPDGVYLNDRDAWTNGFFMGEWAAEVLPLPGLGAEHRQAMRRSALSIAANARTEDGYYSPCWSGPAEGAGCGWSRSPANVRPQQLTVSANTVNVLAAAAAIGRRTPAPTRRAPAMP